MRLVIPPPPSAAAPVRPRRILEATTIVMAFFVASRVLGLVRDIVISHQFGTSRALDAYFAAFNVPDFIFNVVAGGALGSAFIPTFAAALAIGDKDRAWRLASSVINLALGVVAVIALLVAVFAPEVAAATVARGFAPADQAETASLMRWMLITPIVFSVSGIVMGILNSHQHFVLPAAAPVVYNASIIAGALFLAPAWGVYGLAAGVVAGAFLHLFIQVPWLVRERMHYEVGFGLRNPDVREVAILMLPRTFGIAAVQINFVVNTILASALPAGRIAALSYAWRLMQLPVGIVGQSVGTVIFPTLSEHTARNEHGEFQRTFSMALRATLYLTIPAAVGLFILGGPLITLVFQRGQFDANSTSETAWALQWYAIAMFAHSGLEIVNRAFYALHDTKTPVLIGVASMIVNVGLSLVLIGPLEQGGLALANSVATILEMLTLVGLLRWRIGAMESPEGGLDDRRILESVGRILAGAAVMAVVLVALSHLLAARNAILVGLVGMAVGAVVYFSVTAMLHSEEIGYVIHRLTRVTRLAARNS